MQSWHYFPAFAKPHLVGWYHLAFFGVFLPLRIVMRRDKVLPANAPLPDRNRHFGITAISLLLLTFLSLAVARVENIELFPRTVPGVPALLAGLGLYIVAVALMRPRWRRAVETRQRIVYLFMPQTRSEQVGWVSVSVLAGVGEEITWRGVQFSLVGGLTGDPLSAALLSSVSFALGHALQGWRSVAIISIFALGFHGLAWLAGSLYVAMAVHLAYDITAGLTYGSLGKKLGYTPGPAPGTPLSLSPRPDA